MQRWCHPEPGVLNTAIRCSVWRVMAGFLVPSVPSSGEINTLSFHWRQNLNGVSEWVPSSHCVILTWKILLRKEAGCSHFKVYWWTLLDYFWSASWTLIANLVHRRALWWVCGKHALTQHENEWLVAVVASHVLRRWPWLAHKIYNLKMTLGKNGNSQAHFKYLTDWIVWRHKIATIK